MHLGIRPDPFLPGLHENHTSDQFSVYRNRHQDRRPGDTLKHRNADLIGHGPLIHHITLFCKLISLLLQKAVMIPFRRKPSGDAPCIAEVLAAAVYPVLVHQKCIVHFQYLSRPLDDRMDRLLLLSADQILQFRKNIFLTDLEIQLLLDLLLPIRSFSEESGFLNISRDQFAKTILLPGSHSKCRSLGFVMGIKHPRSQIHAAHH